jgi:hypothetical protein
VEGSDSPDVNRMGKDYQSSLLHPTQHGNLVPSLLRTTYYPHFHLFHAQMVMLNILHVSSACAVLSVSCLIPLSGHPLGEVDDDSKMGIHVRHHLSKAFHGPWLPAYPWLVMAPLAF